MKIKKGDTVQIIAGKDRGKTGKVGRVFPKVNKVIIPGLNLFKSHQRPRKQGQKGQVVEKSMPTHISNVMVVDPKSQKPTRIGRRLEGEKMKRYAIKSGQLID